MASEIQERFADTCKMMGCSIPDIRAIAYAYRKFSRYKFTRDAEERLVKGYRDELPTCLAFVDKILDNPKFVHMLIQKQQHADEQYQFWKAKNK